jgi:very-short-patch-repair endonuclease
VRLKDSLLPAGEGRGEGTPSKVTFARELRRRMTIAESKLWWHLRRRALFGVKFRRQHPIGGFIVDFYCDERMLAIELDGGGHADAAKRASDAGRSAELALRGVRVLRFWNNEVLENLDGVLRRIGEAVRPPSP